MVAMQKLQPELKKLQQKYKGPENRQLLNEEMMKLYKEEGVNPLGGCLPMLLQTPFLFMLYSVIKGLANQVTEAPASWSPTRATSRTARRCTTNLVQSGGQIKVLGMDLNLKLFSVHSSFAGPDPVLRSSSSPPSDSSTSRWPRSTTGVARRGQAMPAQQQAMQRFLPLIFAYFYMIIPAAVVLYMIISTAIRILTQYLMFRTGVSNPTKNGVKARRTERRLKRTQGRGESTARRGDPGAQRRTEPNRNPHR